jgi:hypothetical protein
MFDRQDEMEFMHWALDYTIDHSPPPPHTDPE